MGQYQSSHDKKMSGKNSAIVECGVKSRCSCLCMGLCTGECIHGQKNLVGVGMGLYTGGTIDGWAC